MTSSKQENVKNPDCVCRNNCRRRGDCKKCQEYHHTRGSKTSCGK